MTLSSSKLSSALLVALFSLPFGVTAETFTLSPATAGGDEELENVLNSLQPGDEVILMDGEFSQTARRAVTMVGTADNPIIIRAAAGANPVVTRPANQIDQNNNIEIIDSSYVEFLGIHFRGGSIGVRLLGDTTGVTFEDCEVSDTGSNAMSMNENGTTYSEITIRRTHIHDTGLAGNTEGEGMYVGCNNGACVVRDSVFENNYIHTLRGTAGGGTDGIEIKPGSHSNLIRHNVIHDTNLDQAFPCILVYGGGPGINTVDGNVMWNCGQGIQVVSDARVQNNIIFSSDIEGITAAPHAQVPNVQNVEIVNNTIFGHPSCVRLEWGNAQNVEFSNNAVYCPGEDAVNVVGGVAGIEGSSNFIQGNLLGAQIDGVLFSDGGTAMAAFVDPANNDFWLAPNAMLRDAGTETSVPLYDFNGVQRSAPHDVGAYDAGERASNPGWTIGPGFKSLGIDQPPGDQRADVGVPNNTNTDGGNNGGGSGGGANNLGDGPRLPTPSQNADDGCCATTAPRSTTFGWLLLGLIGLVVRLRAYRP